jgi:GH35 family endo-1,4-beta-xylanase
LRDDFGRWNQLTPENEGKWRSMEPTRDEMNWDKMDEYYAYTRSRGIAFKAHTFCWGSQQPDWIVDLPPAEQAAEVEEYIQSYCERYPGVEYIDVVNEPEHAPPTYRDALGGAGATGHDWVIQCFEWARQYCPNATLILNDYNVLRWDTDQFIAIAKKVKATGLVDALGEQGHSLETISMSELKANMQKLAAVGLPILISEYDVDVEDDDEQLAVYKPQFSFFYNHPQVVGITLWGYIQGQTWRENTFLQRSNGTHRPAFDWLLDTYLAEGSLCGNATCDSNEDCNSCGMDCGACDETCNDGELGNGETQIDCGGPCDACPEPEVDAGGISADTGL